MAIFPDALVTDYEECFNRFRLSDGWWVLGFENGKTEHTKQRAHNPTRKGLLPFGGGGGWRTTTYLGGQAHSGWV